MNEKNSASVAEQLKKALARKEQLQSLTDDMLRMTASYPPPLRYESQINTLRKKLLPLQALEDSSKGRLLTLSETKALTGKEEIEQEIERLEEASYGWFEEEDAFRERIQQSRDKFEAKHMRTKRGGGVESHQDDLVEEPGEAAMLQVNGSCQVTSQKEVRGGRHRLERRS
eukprot:g76.t1 g76   contig1:188896-189408(-)